MKEEIEFVDAATGKENGSNTEESGSLNFGADGETSRSTGGGVIVKDDEIIDGEQDGDGTETETEQAETDFEFVTNQKGNRKLYVSSYGFHKHQKYGNLTRWTCEFKKYGCFASASTLGSNDGNQILSRVNNNHDHLPDPSRRAKFIGRHKMKLAVIANTAAPPFKVALDAQKHNKVIGEFFGTTKQLEDVARYTRRKNLVKYPVLPPSRRIVHAIEIKEPDGDSCRLCCLADTRLTNSVNDDVIVNLLNFVPNLSLSDHSSLSARVCQLCYGKAKISVDFINKIQQSQKNFGLQGKISGRPMHLLVKQSRMSTTQDALNKMKRIEGINIKNVNEKLDRFHNEDSDDSFSWPMEAENDDFAKATAVLNRMKSAEVKKSIVDSDSGDVYQPDESFSDSDYEPLTVKRKRSANFSDSHRVSQSSNKLQSSHKASAVQVIVAPPAKFTCGECRKSFENMNGLVAHMKSQACKDDGYRCETCEKMFDKKHKLARHRATHAEKVKFVCDQCGIEFKSSSSLESHIEATHTRVIRENCVFRCSKCSDVFHSQLDLVNHLKYHKLKGGVTDVCKICSKEFTSSVNFQSHMQWHSRKLDRICDICGKGFYQKRYLKQHMHNHTGVKGYPCDLCSSSYANPNSRRRHRAQAHPRASPLIRTYKCRD